MPKWFMASILILITLALLPFAVIARMRAINSREPRIHYIQDMDNQPKFRAQAPSWSRIRDDADKTKEYLFVDERAMRPQVPGTVARGELNEDDHYYRGVVGEGWATTFPQQVTVDMDLLHRGHERFNIYCTPCHGYAGYGDGMVSVRAIQLVDAGTNARGTTWVAPKNMHEELIRDQPIGQTFNTITNGVRNMAGYASQIPVADRWAIVAYVKALQRSQNADADVPADQRRNLPIEDITTQTDETN